MRNIVILTCLLTLSTVGFAKEKGNSPVRVLSTKSDIFYFKVEKEFMNASIEVYDSKGQLLIRGVVTHTKTIIDFYNEAPGHFTVKIKKGDVEEIFEYIKESEIAVPMGDVVSATLSITHA